MTPKFISTIFDSFANLLTLNSFALLSQKGRSLSLSHTHTLSLTHTHSLSLTHTHTLSLSLTHTLSLSVKRTQTRTHTHELSLQPLSNTHRLSLSLSISRSNLSLCLVHHVISSLFLFHLPPFSCFLSFYFLFSLSFSVLLTILRSPVCNSFLPIIYFLICLLRTPTFTLSLSLFRLDFLFSFFLLLSFSR